MLTCIFKMLRHQPTIGLFYMQANPWQYCTYNTKGRSSAKKLGRRCDRSRSSEKTGTELQATNCTFQGVCLVQRHKYDQLRIVLKLVCTHKNFKNIFITASQRIQIFKLLISQVNDCQAPVNVLVDWNQNLHNPAKPRSTSAIHDGIWF